MIKYFASIKKTTVVILAAIMLMAFASSASAAGVVAVQITFPFSSDRNDPTVYTTSSASPMVAFTYTGTPTHIVVSVVDVNSNPVWSSGFIPVDPSTINNGSGVYYLPNTLPKNTTLGVAVNGIDMNDIQPSSTPYSWFKWS